MTTLPMNEPQEFRWCAERLKALGDPERLRIITSLLAGPSHVGALAEKLEEAVVKVSHHLGVLRHSGIVTATKQGRHVEYSLSPEVFVVANVSDSENYLDLGCCRLELPTQRTGGRKRKG